MNQEQQVWKHQKKLKTGYTTGSCAAAATKAAVTMLLSGEIITQVGLDTPKGIRLYLDVEQIEKGHDFIRCGVKKDSGDDPDITNGVYVFARVSKKSGKEIVLTGGDGIGRVTRKGLDQAVGEAAINSVPRQMIREAAEEVCQKCQYEEGLTIEISIPEGTALAGKTFNPRLGIEGGISVLGTTGIVEPMSEKALTDTIHLELKVLKEAGHNWCYVVPGNYGSDFLSEEMGFDSSRAVKCSNYLGETIDYAFSLEMKGFLLIGHVGKLVKTAAGIMNTHSRQADCRAEVFAAHAALAGGSRDLIRQIMAAATTVEMVDILAAEGLLAPVMDTVMERMEFHLGQRGGQELAIGAIMFSREHGILGKTPNAGEILKQIQEG